MIDLFYFIKSCKMRTKVYTKSIGMEKSRMSRIHRICKNITSTKMRLLRCSIFLYGCTLRKTGKRLVGFCKYIARRQIGITDDISGCSKKTSFDLHVADRQIWSVHVQKVANIRKIGFKRAGDRTRWKHFNSMFKIMKRTLVIWKRQERQIQR